MLVYVTLSFVLDHYKMMTSEKVYFHFFRVYCLIGDGESAEGSIWEALHFASYYKLDNLCVIFDVNRLGQSEPTSLQHNMDVYRKRLDAFGWNAIVVDGHDVEELCKVLCIHVWLTFQQTGILFFFFPGNSRTLDITMECTNTVIFMINKVISFGVRMAMIQYIIERHTHAAFITVFP
jgi:hypothetical protein